MGDLLVESKALRPVKTMSRIVTAVMANEHDIH